MFKVVNLIGRPPVRKKSRHRALLFRYSGISFCRHFAMHKFVFIIFCSISAFVRVDDHAVAQNVLQKIGDGWRQGSGSQAMPTPPLPTPTDEQKSSEQCSVEALERRFAGAAKTVFVNRCEQGAQ
jgi:hypothetical protein